MASRREPRERGYRGLEVAATASSKLRLCTLSLPLGAAKSCCWLSRQREAAALLGPHRRLIPGQASSSTTSCSGPVWLRVVEARL